MTEPLLAQPSALPTRKVLFAGAVGTPLAATIVAALLSLLGLDIDAAAAGALLSAFGAIVAAITGYWTREKAPPDLR